MFKVYAVNKPGKSFQTVSYLASDEAAKAWTFETYPEAFEYATKHAKDNANTNKAILIVEVKTFIYYDPAPPIPYITEYK